MPSGDRNLPDDDLVGLQALDDLVEGGAIRQLVRHHRRGIALVVGFAAGREHGHQAVDAVGQLQIDDRPAHGLEAGPREQPRSLDHEQDIVLARGE